MTAGWKIRFAGAVLGVALVSAGAARAADPICDVLGPAVNFTVAAKEFLRTNSSTSRRGYIPNPIVFKSACAPTMKLGPVGQWFRDVVATASTGTAIDFKVVMRTWRCGYLGYQGGPYCPPYPCYGDLDSYPCNGNVIHGDLVTGGGTIRAPGALMPQMYNYGAIDTSGTHPDLVTCEETLAELDALSETLAQGLLPGEPPSAARPIMDLGNVRVAREDTLTLSTTPGESLTVYRVGDLVLEPGRLYGYGGYSYQGEGAFLELESGEGEMLAIIVTRALKVGRGAEIFENGGDNPAAILNLVGSGARVVLRRRAAVNTVVLAPGRDVFVEAQGGTGEYPYGRMANVFARRVTLRGSAYMGYFGVDPESCSPSGAFLEPHGDG